MPFSPLFNKTNIPYINPHTWPLLTTPPPTPPFIVMVSPPPFSKITFEATCGSTSELNLTKSSSEFFTLASPHTTQLTSSEDCPREPSQPDPIWNICCRSCSRTPSQIFPCSYLPWAAPATPTPTHPRTIHYAHLDWRPTLC